MSRVMLELPPLALIEVDAYSLAVAVDDAHSIYYWRANTTHFLFLLSASAAVMQRLQITNIVSNDNT